MSGAESETPDPVNRANYERESVVTTLEAVDEYLGEDSLAHFRARDIAPEAERDARVVGGVLALVTDAPGVVEAEYDIDLEVSSSRWGQQPAGTVWRVSRDA